MATIQIKSGDEVIVIAGSAKGTKAKVTQVFPRLGKVVVEGVNVRTRHLKARGGQQGQAGQKVSFAMPIDASNVQLVGSDGKPMRHSKRTK